MRHLKQWAFASSIAFALATLLAIKEDFPVIMAAGVLGAVAVSIIFVLVLVAVKLTKGAGLPPDFDVPPTFANQSLNGFDAEGNLMIHSWLWHGGK